MRQIAFYGKGGIGKSTTTSNISAALGYMGYRVMQIGCDPKADSTNTLTQGKTINNILDIIRDKQVQVGSGKNGQHINLEDLVFRGFKDICCCEAGGPEPGVGCAGRGIITAIEMLKTHKAFEIYNPDYVFFDVLGDVVCGGFAMPIRQGLADEVYVVTSGEKMALYACNNIFKGIEKFAKSGNTRVGGIILNSRGTEHEIELIEDFACKTETRVVHVIPRDKIVQKSEMLGMTTIEYDAACDQASSYLELATKLTDSPSRSVPKAMTPVEFNEWARTHSNYF